MSDTSETCPPDFTLERHLAGELAADSPEGAHVATCSSCATRLSAMRAEGAAYMQSDDANAVRKALAAKPSAPSVRSRAAWWWTVAAPIAAAAVWLALYRPPTPNDLAAKGAPTVELLVGHAGQVAPWNGAALAAGDPLQLSWTSSRAAYVAVIGREEQGTTAETTKWFPGEDAAPRLEPGTRTFGDSLRFDPPFHGTVYIFIADAPFSTAAVEAALREGQKPTFAGETHKLHIPRAP
jgi:hypothetical protein